MKVRNQRLAARGSDIQADYVLFCHRPLMAILLELSLLVSLSPLLRIFKAHSRDAGLLTSLGNQALPSPNFDQRLQGFPPSGFQAMLAAESQVKGYQSIRKPPLTSMISPVMKEVLSEARKATASATSSGLPILPRGMALTTFFRFSSDHSALISVSMA